ncbi:MAG TPA: outer membrane protein assembly factor BamA [Stellaceae bacterium]|nr:outer membrane protein assembly factor BamA [Stellaceae bacterium]
MRNPAGASRALAIAAFLLAAALLPASAQAPAPAPALAPAQTGGTIEEIRIEGAERVEPETVRSYLQVGPGDAFNSDLLDKSLKSLFATGLFTDVTLRREGNALIVRVVENPVINRIAFEGNKKLKDETLLSEIQLKPRTVYTRQKVQSDVARLLDLYRRNGRFAATVEPKIVQLPQNRVDLVFEITEGDFTGVKSISFIGNRHFSSNSLRDVIDTKESRWWRFLTSVDTYDPDRISYDRELLRKFYLSEGYADFRVLSAVAELTPSRDGFMVTFNVEEGERYHFGKIDLTNQLPEVDPAGLKALLITHQGDWYNADQIERSITILTEVLGTRGFAFVDIQPQAHRNAADRTIDVTYVIKEGPRVYVERIDINGNLRTLDSVIRRELRIAEGDAFNTTQMQRSEQRIKNLNFFKKAAVTNVKGSAPDKTVVNVDVEEKSTGDFTFGVGFSTTDGPLIDAGVHERNLLGKGYDLRVDLMASFRSQQGNISFTDPYFQDRNLAVGFDLFVIQRNNQDFAGFSQFTVGGDVRAGYQITDALRQTLKYTLREDRIYNICTSANTSASTSFFGSYGCTQAASLYVQQEAGTRVTSAVGHNLLYDRRDSATETTAGWFASLGNDFAGIGGDARYIRTSLSGGVFHSWAPDWVASLTGQAGDILGIGQPVVIEDRFFVGGDNLRGFATGGIGPRDENTNSALGGNIYYAGSLTQGFPLGFPHEFGLTGRVWTDFGSLFDINAPTNSANPIEKSAMPRVSAGIGVSWKSPFGPIRLDIGQPIVKESWDKKSLFRVGFGSTF